MNIDEFIIGSDESFTPKSDLFIKKINEFKDKYVKVIKINEGEGNKDDEVVYGKLKIVEGPTYFDKNIHCIIQVGDNDLDPKNKFNVIQQIKSIELDNATTGGKKKKSRKQKNKSRKTKKSRKSRPLKN